ncbi:MAG TPA: carboxymuconolactone decarboxylase family protein [Nocardioides sp.]|uniref:carboxymuconolactone decarboxylase family protein n=1 Tax=uncultured Nocardioides sp. TaxID=198441 RepID=UPI000EC809FB|nr:carboxymuconolactone decarboxylase family protein [uncultured Nocardioides sp.]HCB06216.1 gamma-carboxymuconolactone decarboxylase [Nocardioides sp.]HRD59623.1 carboxymuconolactone decarboxylase family protein [Nocardioides sp.]HRI94244.1 carboxymuconolactone decarboxylase family protein [Nocardioides sp.]HRK44303.1 carboxymuconolactone decarboxylase family protein [Nocardioides sp.]
MHEDDERYQAGLRARAEVLGRGRLEATLAAPASPTMQRWQRYLTEEGWGGVWCRPGLDRKSRSLITVTALAMAGRDHELALHLQGARRNGWTQDELGEALIHLVAYAGYPAAVAAFRLLDGAFAEELPV